MPCKILLVEDDPDFRAVLAMALELQGFMVRQAAGGHKALEALSIERPDLIISDLEMNGIDGRALCKHARADTAFADIPIVVLSAFVDPDRSQNLDDLPADCLLSKQVPLSQLVDLIRGLLDGPRRRAQTLG
jgi:two-component system response regulator MprA